MISGQRLRDELRLLRLSAKLLIGKRYWAVPLFALLWPVFIRLMFQFNFIQTAYLPEEAQNGLIGLPLTILGVMLGGKIIAGEIDRRTLEIAYTVPGGAHRIWTSKLLVTVIILLVTEVVLAIPAWFFYTEFPMTALYGALQAAMFYTVVSMSLAALFKSEASGALVVAVILFLNFILGNIMPRISPFWNPEAALRGGADPADVLAWTIQNRIGFVFAIAAVIAMGFTRAERREKLL
jgi:ABC-type transport system involved in multi-copper enzyme maturation permease subunit